MRVSACGWAGRTLEEALVFSDAVTGVTHNHPEGLKGARAVTAAIYLLRTGTPVEQVREHIVGTYYPLDFTLDEIRPDYEFDVSCQGSVPQALEAFFEAKDFEDAIRNAISIGGDSDTIGAITGAVAEARWGVPDAFRTEALARLYPFQREVVADFEERFGRPAPETEKANAVDREKALGALWGLIVGDCLGSPIQFTEKDGHPHITEMVPCEMFCTPPGYWTDDGSMALCVAESVARLGRFDRADVGNNFVRWLRDGFLSSLPHAFDVGGATWRSVTAIGKNGSLENGEESSQGNGSVMRLAPSWLAARAFGRPAILHECSDLTHRSRRVRETVDRMAGILDELAATGATSAVSRYATRDEVDNSGWCVSTVEAALWALNSTESFEDALVAAVNLGGDADSIGAVCGQLAGAKYGVGAIPERWLAAVKDRAKLDGLFDRFLAALDSAGEAS